MWTVGLHHNVCLLQRVQISVCNFDFKFCRTLIVDVHAVRYADNSRWDGLTDEEERHFEERTKEEMLHARMREVPM